MSIAGISIVARSGWLFLTVIQFKNAVNVTSIERFILNTRADMENISSGDAVTIRLRGGAKSAR